VRVYEQKKIIDPATSKEIYFMSNGMSYTIKNDQWTII
jgi:hypothetical protein